MTNDMVKYGSFDLDDANEIDEEMQKSAGSFLKLKEGRTVVRFLPGRSGAKPFVLVQEHQLNMPNGDFVNFACPRLMAKERCDMCDKADRLKASGNPADYERAKDLFPKRRIYCAVLVRGAEETGPKTFSIGKTIWDDLKEIREDFGDMTQPDTGYDIAIRRKGAGKNDTEYKAKEVSGATPLTKEMLDLIPELSRYAKVLTPTEIAELLGGGKRKDRGADRDPRTAIKKEEKKTSVVDAEFEEAGDDDLPI